MPMGLEQKEIIVDYITGTFIWTFKKGDNIVYNFEILWALYEAKKHYSGNKLLYNKPIAITIISIIECILDDFVHRIKQRSTDPLPNITPQVINDFKYKKKGQSLGLKKLGKFIHYIDISEKHKIFGNSKKTYLALHFLRDVRNKVHIQLSDEDEDRIFTESNLDLSEKALKYIIKTMVEKYPRSDSSGHKLIKFPFPWEVL